MSWHGQNIKVCEAYLWIPQNASKGNNELHFKKTCKLEMEKNKGYISGQRKALIVGEIFTERDKQTVSTM
jgi:hypothetical protein